MSLAKTGCKPFKRQPHRVIKHTQIICRLLLKFCLSVYDIICGAGDEGVKDVNINFFLDKFHIDALLLCFFSPDQMLLFIEICVTVLFLNFKLIFLSVLCFIYKSLVLLYHFKVIKEFTFLIYLSMPIDNLTWQARVGIFNSSKPLFKTKIKNRGMLQFLLHYTVYSLYLFLTFILIKQVNNLYQVSSRLMKIIPAFFACFPQNSRYYCFLFFFIQNLLSCCGDIEENPGPKYSSLTFCHWNLNGLTAHDSTKISLLQAYITQHNDDIICLTEIFLNSSILSDDNRIKIDEYYLIRSDHPSVSKKGGVCIYYKEHIPLILRDDISTLDNCLVTEIRSLCSIVTGGFNARCSRWWKNDITNLQGQELDSLALSAGYNQVID